LGGHVERCEDCAHLRICYNSCRNRHCPKCQAVAAKEWLADRQAELLPVPYFHVVFTLPGPIAEIAYQNKAVVYDLLLKIAAETLITIAADPKHLGARIGLTAVLHTWGSPLTHHPHAHIIVPGGGLSSVDAPLQARENVGVVVARGRMLSSVRPLMRQEDSRRPVWEFADRVQITQSVLEALWKALVIPAPSRRLLRHTLLPLALTSSRSWSAYAAAAGVR
jgi:hypothetical protein